MAGVCATNSPKREASESRRPSRWRLFWSLLLLALIGALVWVIYGLGSGGLTVFGNCGGTDFLGFPMGRLRGGAASSAPAAAAIGAVLFVAAGAAMWRTSYRRLHIALACIGLYGFALVVLAAVSPLVWGHKHCVLY